MKNTLVLACAGLIAALSYATPAYAYLDPGTGSIILQLLLGGVAGGIVIFKLYWSKVKSFFGVAEKPQKKREDVEGD